MDNESMDISKIIETVKIISDNMPKNSDNSNTNKDMDMAKMLEIISLLNRALPKKDSETQSPLPLVAKEEPLPTLYFEQELNTPAIKTIKSALPYLDQKYQKSISIAIRLVEIQMILGK